ncbi:MAG: hypothetical protein QOD09_4522 [Bradyrhizobium sp.]|nr:hypothetical protein [Bradyrhizobium sp.]
MRYELTDYEWFSIRWRRATTGLQETTLPSFNSHLSAYYNYVHERHPSGEKRRSQAIAACGILSKAGFAKSLLRN